MRYYFYRWVLRSFIRYFDQAHAKVWADMPAWADVVVHNGTRFIPGRYLPSGKVTDELGITIYYKEVVSHRNDLWQTVKLYMGVAK